VKQLGRRRRRDEIEKYVIHEASLSEWWGESTRS